MPMAGKWKKAPLALTGLLTLGLLAAQIVLDAPQARGQQALKSAYPITYKFTVDYPVGGKEKYIEWVKAVADDLLAPKQLRRLTSYDDYFGASPNRHIDFEFDNMEDAAAYFEDPRVSNALKDWHRYGFNVKVQVLRLRGDYPGGRE